MSAIRCRPTAEERRESEKEPNESDSTRNVRRVQILLKMPQPTRQRLRQPRPRPRPRPRLPSLKTRRPRQSRGPHPRPRRPVVCRLRAGLDVLVHGQLPGAGVRRQRPGGRAHRRRVARHLSQVRLVDVLRLGGRHRAVAAGWARQPERVPRRRLERHDGVAPRPRVRHALQSVGERRHGLGRRRVRRRRDGEVLRGA